MEDQKGNGPINPANQAKLQPWQEALEALAATEDGQIFLKHLMTQCHFHVSTVVGDPQSHEINVYGTLFNEARRRLYLDIRRYIPVNLRRKIEG